MAELTEVERRDELRRVRIEIFRVLRHYQVQPECMLEVAAVLYLHIVRQPGCPVCERRLDFASWSEQSLCDRHRAACVEDETVCGE